MRRRLRAGRYAPIALLAGGALLLAACGPTADTGTGGATVTPGTAAATPSVTFAGTNLDEIEVAGEFGKVPQVTFPAPFGVATDAAKVVSAGKGAKLEEGKLVVAALTQFSGTSGKQLQSSLDTGDDAQFPLDRTKMSPALFNAVADKPVGSRVLLATAPLKQQAQAGPAPETQVFIIDILGQKEQAVPLARATGTAVVPPEGLPTVELDGNGKPTITVPTSPPSNQLVIQPLIKGTGPQVKTGQSVTVNYTGVTYDGGQQFDSSWDRGQPFTVENIGGGAVIKGWDQGLVGQTVGSQVLLVIPPDLGYGAAGSPPSIPGNATLVFVVDILAAN